MTNGGSALRKRLYREVGVGEGAGPHPAFRILLDRRGLRTPAKRELAVPTRPLAEAIAAEWRAQAATIDPLSMPLTRIVNSALDGVTGREMHVRAAILGYGRSDLLCYLADRPPDLVERQSRRWGAIHAWVERAFGVELELAVGVMPVEQDDDAIATLDRALGAHGPLALAALHVATTLTGSLLLTLALVHGRIGAEEAWSLAHIDEDFQIERWGADAEASLRRARRWEELQAACHVMTSINDR